MNEPTPVNQIDQTIPPVVQPPKVSTLGYLLWSLAIPPFTIFIAMYFAWKKGILFKLVPNITIVYTVLFALWSLLMFWAPGAFSSYFSQQVPVVPSFYKIFATILIIGGIGGGIYLRMKAQKDGSLSLVWIGLMIVNLILQVVAGFHQLTFISGVVTKAQDTSLGL